MKCYFHNEKDAVVTCNSCGKGICKNCAVNLESGSTICPNCFKSIINSQKAWLKKVKFRFIMTGVIFTFLFILSVKEGGTVGNFLTKIILALFLSSFPVSILTKSPDPYVPTSMEAAGKLALLNLFVHIITGPVMLILVFMDYIKTKKIKEENEKSYEERLATM